MTKFILIIGQCRTIIRVQLLRWHQFAVSASGALHVLVLLNVLCFAVLRDSLVFSFYRHVSFVSFYATTDEADAYMFYRCFFLFFFRSPQKYQTTVLGNC